MGKSSPEPEQLNAETNDEFGGAPPPLKRLWTPWRMGYVASTPQSSGRHESGCVFCQHLASNDDVRSLILYRGQHSFAIMNLFPYNTGHLMLLPNAHVPGPESAPPEALAEMTAMLPGFLLAMRTALNCAGFNIGMNIGEVAGAGIASHLHQHIVPRWPGDANFMPVLAATKVLPELLPVTYAKIRAEIDVRLLQQPLTIIALSERGEYVLVETARNRLPVFSPPTTGAIWRGVVDWFVAIRAGAARVVGWVDLPNNRPAIVMECSVANQALAGFRWVSIAALESADQLHVRKALESTVQTP